MPTLNIMLYYQTTSCWLNFSSNHIGDIRTIQLEIELGSYKIGLVVRAYPTLIYLKYNRYIIELPIIKTTRML